MMVIAMVVLCTITTVLRARGLSQTPNNHRPNAYVTIQEEAVITLRTQTMQHNQNPVWNEEFEV